MPVPAGPGSVITVDEVKARLRKTAINVVGDDRIQQMIDAAEAAYTRYVGPIAGTETEYFDGGGTELVLASPNATAVTVAVYDDGSAITVADLTVRNGIVRWTYGTAGRFTYGVQNVAITYTVGTLPPDHREEIVDAIAWYFGWTYRGPANVPSEGDGPVIAPTWAAVRERIQALAEPVIG